MDIVRELMKISSSISAQQRRVLYIFEKRLRGYNFKTIFSHLEKLYDIENGFR